MNTAERRVYGDYVHVYTATDGQPRYAVGWWDESRAQYVRPFDVTEQRLTGCYAEFGRLPRAMQSFSTRRRALRRARYLWGRH